MFHLDDIGLVMEAAKRALRTQDTLSKEAFAQLVASQPLCPPVRWRSAFVAVAAVQNLLHGAWEGRDTRVALRPRCASASAGHCPPVPRSLPTRHVLPPRLQHATLRESSRPMLLAVGSSAAGAGRLSAPPCALGRCPPRLSPLLAPPACPRASCTAAEQGQGGGRSSQRMARRLGVPSTRARQSACMHVAQPL